MIRLEIPSFLRSSEDGWALHHLATIRNANYNGVNATVVWQGNLQAYFAGLRIARDHRFENRGRQSTWGRVEEGKGGPLYLPRRFG